MRAGEDLLRRYRDDPSVRGEADRQTGRLLGQMAATGRVPMPPDTRNPVAPERYELAGKLFLTLRADEPGG